MCLLVLEGLSPILFNIAIEEALRKVAEMDIGVEVGTRMNILAFADDVVVFTEQLDLKTLARLFMREAEKIGVKTNDSKTK